MQKHDFQKIMEYNISAERMLRILNFFLYLSSPPCPGAATPGQFVDIVQWQNTSLPSWLHGFDSRYRLHRQRTAISPIPPKVWARAGDPGL